MKRCALQHRNAAMRGFIASASLVMASTASGTVCNGPALRGLRFVDAHTLEVQGLGGTAQTRDHGKTWLSPRRVVKPLLEPLDQRAFTAPGGAQLQNLEGSWVIQRETASSTWRVRWQGLLLQVMGNSAFVYVGEYQPKLTLYGDHSWELMRGAVEERPADPSGGFTGRSAALKVEFRPGSVCVHTEADPSWFGECKPALELGAQASFQLTGFAVAPEAAESEYPGARDVYLSTPDSLLHWQAGSKRWLEMNYPPDWRQCNGPIPLR